MAGLDVKIKEVFTAEQQSLLGFVAIAADQRGKPHLRTTCKFVAWPSKY